MNRQLLFAIYVVTCSRVCICIRSSTALLSKDRLVVVHIISLCVPTSPQYPSRWQVKHLVLAAWPRSSSCCSRSRRTRASSKAKWPLCPTGSIRYPRIARKAVPPRTAVAFSPPALCLPPRYRQQHLPYRWSNARSLLFMHRSRGLLPVLFSREPIHTFLGTYVFCMDHKC